MIVLPMGSTITLAQDCIEGKLTMRIAVASRDGCTVSGHIGQCADWIVYEVSESATAVVTGVEHVVLPRELVFHHYKDDGPHPLQSCRAVIGASAGDSFVTKMQRRGIAAVLTAESDPATAAIDYVRHTLAPPRLHPFGRLLCKLRDRFSSQV